MDTPVAATQRGPLAGVRMILRYNWPLYLAGLVAAVGGATVATARGWHPLVRASGAGGALGAGWLAIASLVASWWVYDRSELYRWTWLHSSVPEQPNRVLVVHAGLDEASEPVRSLWPEADVTSVDVHGGSGPTTASLERARSMAPTAEDPRTQRVTEVDAVVAFLAAHEVRTAEGRTGLLTMVRESLRPGGRLVLVEHVRDIANALVYGPAVGHFYPAREWRDAIGAAGLEPVTERRITPFVILLTVEKPT